MTDLGKVLTFVVGISVFVLVLSGKKGHREPQTPTIVQQWTVKPRPTTLQMGFFEPNEPNYYAVVPLGVVEYLPPLPTLASVPTLLDAVSLLGTMRVNVWMPVSPFPLTPRQVQDLKFYHHQ